MNNEFKKVKLDGETRFVLEFADGGATSAGSIASVEKPLGELQRRAEPQKPRNFVAKNAKMGGAGQHKDKKKAEKQGDTKHKNKSFDMAEGKEDKIAQLKKDHDTAVHWSKNETSPQKREAARRKAETIKAHLEKQYKQGVAEGSEKHECSHCNGSGRMVRDPDIGTDQECFVCDGTGYVNDEQGVAEAEKNPHPKTWHDVDPKLGKAVDKMSQAEKVKKGWAMDPSQRVDPRTGKKMVQKGVAEGEVVPLGKKHRGDLGDIHSCPKCGGELQGGNYMGQRVKVCQPCKQVYLPPNSGIDQQGNKTNEQGVAEGAMPPSPKPQWSVEQNAKRLQSQKEKAKAQFLKKKERQQGVAEGDSGAKYKVKSIGYDSKGDYYISPSTGKKVYKKADKGDHENPKTGEIKKKVAEDHEIQMASSELQSIAKNAQALLHMVRKYSEQEGLDAWQQSKITKAADYLNAVLQSVSGEQNPLEGAGVPSYGVGGYRNRGDDERHDLDDVELQRNRQEVTSYNITVDGKPINPKPIFGRSATIAWGKEQSAAGVDLSNAMISPVRYTEDAYMESLTNMLERSVSQAQHNLMVGVAHNPAFAQKVKVKRAVGQEFANADQGHDISKLPIRVPKKK